MLQIRVLPQDGSEFSGETHRVSLNGYKIGREPSCDLVLNDPSISRNHSVLLSGENGTWILKDQGSRNGLVHLGERKPEVVVSGLEPIHVHLGEILLELSLAPLADVTQTIDLAAIRAKSLGGRAESQPLWSFLLRWMLGGFVFLLAGTGLQFLTRSESETAGRIVAITCGIFFMILLLAVVFSLVSKLNRREYRFQRIFRLTFLAMGVSFFLDPLANLLIGQATSAGTQLILDLIYNGAILGTGLVFVLKETFPGLRIITSAGIVAGLLVLLVEIRPITNLVSRSYRASPEPVPMLKYPLPGASWKHDLSSVFSKMDLLRPEIDEDRKEILKLR